MRRLSISLVFFFAGFFTGPGARPGGLRIALLADAEIRGDSIFLANFLPPDASRAVRAAAEKIMLGATPQNGTSRILSRSSVVAAVTENGLSASAFLIPELMTVQRAAHLVTREEVFAAIQRALAGVKIAELPAFGLDDISLNASVLLPDQESQLEVTQITFDEFIGRARFRLWAKSAPGVHPFYATARIPSASPGMAVSPLHSLNADFLPFLPAPQVASPVLVEAGRAARLHLHSPNSSMMLQVKPLQRGRLGQTIRVRMPSNGKTLQARVIGEGFLDATF
jgi:hypothetical protein